MKKILERLGYIERDADGLPALSGSGQKGFILILALVTMLAMSIIGISLMMNMTTDMQLARNERDSKQAFQLAEAGFNEAFARMKLLTTNARYMGEPAGTTGYRTTAAYGGSSFTSTLSADSGNLPTGQSYSASVAYLTETNTYCDTNSVANTTSPFNVTFLANDVADTSACVNNNEVVMYGRDFGICFSSTSPCTNPPAKVGTFPVYIVTATGTSNGTSKTVEAYISSSSLNVDIGAGISTNGCVTISGGAANVTGGVKEAGACGACETGVDVCNAKSTDNMSQYLTGTNLDDVKSMANEVHYCVGDGSGAQCDGPSDDINAAGTLDTGGDPILDFGDFAGNTNSTIIYIDNPIKEVDITGNISGRGILVVTGDLKISGNVQYEGLIYVLGKITISGGGPGLNVTGGVMSNGIVDLNGGITVNYSAATLADVARQAGGKAMIMWRRL